MSTDRRLLWVRWRIRASSGGVITLLAIVAGICFGRTDDDPKRAGPTKVPGLVLVPPQDVDIETDAAFAGTWKLVEKSEESTLTAIGDQIVVEEYVIEFGPDKGRTRWVWHQSLPAPPILTHWTPLVNWAPERMPGKPWPIIELRRGSSQRRHREKAIYQLRGDTLSLGFQTKDGLPPKDFVSGPGRDVEVWRRIAAPMTRLEPDSGMNGRWRLSSITFHASGTYGSALNMALPEHLTGTKAPVSPLREGIIFEVKDGSWHEEDKGDKGVSWSSTRELRLPKRVYLRWMADPRPPGIPEQEIGEYRLGQGSLTLSFSQAWLAPNIQGDVYYYTGTRTEVYERMSSKPPPKE